MHEKLLFLLVLLSFQEKKIKANRKETELFLTSILALKGSWMLHPQCATGFSCSGLICNEGKIFQSWILLAIGLVRKNIQVQNIAEGSPAVNELSTNIPRVHCEVLLVTQIACNSLSGSQQKMTAPEFWWSTELRWSCLDILVTGRNWHFAVICWFFGICILGLWHA